MLVSFLLLLFAVSIGDMFAPCRLEGIIPALETSHAIAYLSTLVPTLKNGTRVVINCSGRGDKDVNNAMKYLNI